MTQPPYPGQYQTPAQGFAPASGPRPSAGLAIASLVLGILALLVSLVPVLNLGGMFLAFIGGVLGVVALLRGHGGRGMAIAGVVLAALALIIAILVNLAFNSFMTAFGGDPTSPSTSVTSSAGGPPASPSADPTGSAPAAPLAFGQVSSTGKYDVTVTAMNPNGNEIVATQNQFNEPPTGQYVLVDVSTTYTGDETGTPWMDLSFKYQGTDARDYSEAPCAIDNSGLNVPELRNGGTGTYTVCFDVPPEAIAGGHVKASELWGSDGPQPVWATQ